MGKILSVCSGSGGVGKSTAALAIAAEAARRGMKTILLDASGTSRSCDLMLGLESVVVLDMMDVAAKQTSIQSALYPVPGRGNLEFACASLYEGMSLSELSGILLALRTMSDLLVIDQPTGRVTVDESLQDADDALLMITRPDDASIRATERVMSAMPMSGAQRFLFVNRMNKAWVKKKMQYDLRSVEMILDLPASCCVYEDEGIPFGCKKGKTAAECSGHVRSEIDRLLREWL